MFLCLYFDILVGTFQKYWISFNSSTKEVSFEWYFQNQKLKLLNFVVDSTIKEVWSLLLTPMNRLRIKGTRDGVRPENEFGVPLGKTWAELFKAGLR